MRAAVRTPARQSPTSTARGLNRTRRATRQPEGENMSSRDEQEDKTIYKVVVNHEEQYSIWPADRENALGWNDAGKTGTKAECLAYIEEVWTDMRPLSLRKKMEEDAQAS
jgi:MbtH protein